MSEKREFLERNSFETRGESKRRVCPDCGAPLIDSKVCPECGADLRSRTSHKFAALICVIVLAFGLTYYTYAGIRGKYWVVIKDIDEDLNYGYVWIEGTVSGGPEYSETSDKLEFSVYDGTDEITVKAYGEVTNDLLEENQIPSVGDNVKVFGMVRAEDQMREVRIETAKKFSLEPATAKPSTITQIIEDFDEMKYQRVTVEGILINMVPWGWMNKYTIKDETTDAELNVIFTSGIDELDVATTSNDVSVTPENLTLYSRLRVTAGVSEYGGRAQLIPSSYRDIKVIGQENLPHTISVGEAREAKYGEFVGVQGKIVLTTIRSSGCALTLDNTDDNEYPLPVWIWNNVYDLIPEEKERQLRRGVIVEVYGFRILNRYGRKNLTLAAPPVVHIVDNSGMDIYKIDLVNIRDITENDVPIFVKVQGSVTTSVTSWAEGKVFDVDDGTGIISVNVWDANWLRIPDEKKPQQGDNVKITGIVMEYKGDLYLYPGLPEDVVVS